jgi:hypothetical protein
MLKSILGMIAGYVAISLFFFAAFAGVYFTLGVERIFQSDSYEVSTLWLILSAATGLGGGILGGYLCAAISGSQRACELFATILLIVLIAFCLPKMRDRSPVWRAGDVPFMDAMRLTQMPLWMHVLNPVLGAVGVLLGARMKKAR